MSNLYDDAIGWCKKKVETTKKHRLLSGKRLEGYEMAMLAVMSYLHCEKERRGADNEIVFMRADREFGPLPYCPNCGAKMDGKGEGE